MWVFFRRIDLSFLQYSVLSTHLEDAILLFLCITEKGLCASCTEYFYLNAKYCSFLGKGCWVQVFSCCQNNCGFELCRFFPTGTQNVEQERELLQHHLKGKGKRQLGKKWSFFPFRRRKKREIPSVSVISPFLKCAAGGQWDSCCFLRNEKLLGLLSLESWAYFP